MQVVKLNESMRAYSLKDLAEQPEVDGISDVSRLSLFTVGTFKKTNQV